MYSLRLSNGIRWDFAVHEGLKVSTSGSSAFRIRSGRQKTAEATAKDLAGTSRLKYTGVPGLEFAASVNYQSDASQQDNDGLDDGLFYAGHIIYHFKAFQFRSLYARWDLNGSAAETADADQQDGWYIEPSIKPFGQHLLPALTDKLGFYFRYQDLNGARTRDRFSQWETGLNYWPHPSVVIKFDYRDREHDLNSDAGRDFTGFDLGIGYQF